MTGVPAVMVKLAPDTGWSPWRSMTKQDSDEAVAEMLRGTVMLVSEFTVMAPVKIMQRESKPTVGVWD